VEEAVVAVVEEEGHPPALTTDVMNGKFVATTYRPVVDAKDPRLTAVTKRYVNPTAPCHAMTMMKSLKTSASRYPLLVDVDVNALAV
jgi:hypothetical protein